MRNSIKEAENEDVRTCLRSILKRKFMGEQLLLSVLPLRMLAGKESLINQYIDSYIWFVFVEFGKTHYFCLKRIWIKMQLVLSTSIDLVRITPDGIVYIASDGNYSTLVQADGETRMLSFQLGQIEKMIACQLGSEGELFIRIGKSLIINRSYIYYINVPKQKLILSDAQTFSHTVSASKEALRQLKELLEKEVKQ